MSNGYALYSEIKSLLEKHRATFNDSKTYEAFIKDLAELLNI